MIQASKNLGLNKDNSFWRFCNFQIYTKKKPKTQKQRDYGVNKY